MRILAAFAFLFVGLLATTGRAEERIAFPGTAWSLIPPKGFVLTRTPIALFKHPSTSAIMIIQNPPQALDKDSFGAIGSIQGDGANEGRLDAVREITAGGKKGYLLNFWMTRRNARSLTAIIQGDASNALVVGVVPQAAFEIVDLAAIEASLLTALESSRTLDDRTSDLPYEFTDLAGMRVSDVAAGSFTIVTDGPQSDYKTDFKQTYALVMTMDTGQMAIDFTREAEPAKQYLLQEYPNAEILGHKMISTPRGNVLEISYMRTEGTASTKLSGTAWFRNEGRTLLIMITQYPGGQVASYDKLSQLRDGLAIK